jgi:chemotaxis protein MotB
LSAPAGKAGATRIIYIKKKGGHGGHHGGAWKVAYADFVTAMMALFMVMWLLAQTDQETRQQLSEYFRTGMFSGATNLTQGGSGVLDRGFLDVNDAEPAIPRTDPGLKMAARKIQEAVAKASKDLKITNLDSHVRIKVTEDGMLIQLVDGGEDLLFDRSSAKLKSNTIEVLKRLGEVLGRLPNALQIHGHTDARMFPKGSGRNNWELSFDRADAARDILEESGLRAGQIAGVFAHGSTVPFNPRDPLAPENRRISILAVRLGTERNIELGQPLEDLPAEKPEKGRRAKPR